MADRNRRRFDWLDLLAALAALAVVILFVIAMLDAWVISTPGDLAHPI